MLNKRAFVWAFRKRYLHSPALQWSQMNMERIELSRDDRSSIENHWHDQVVNTKRQGNSRNENKYVLSMFPYPSGNLHMGHVRVYTISDCIARYFSLKGYDVLHPIGWDAFGLPAENAAIDRKEIPSEWIKKNIKSTRQQMLDLSCRFDWDRELITSDPRYYRWTQWIFLQMYKAGLIYQHNSFVNWDPIDCTVLASEQIDDNGKAWRSGAQVEQKLLKQWFVKTTKFAKPLYDNLEHLNEWRDIVDVQREWIGKVNVYRFSFKLYDANSNRLDDFVDIFVEDPSDLGNLAYLSLSKNHHLWQAYDKVNKNGVDCLTVTALNPITGYRLPLVLGSDKCFGLDQFIQAVTLEEFEDADFQVLKNLGLSTNDVKRLDVDDQSVIDKADKEGWGGYLTSNRLGDWVVSRQRYWGTPIPIIHCTKCGVVPVPESELPVVLPKLDVISAVGGSPLKSARDWVNVKCPKCSMNAQRETDTLDTFFDSAWYFLRYLDPQNEKEIFSKEECVKMMPVDVYVGGKEHACLHLFFARFFCHFLKSIGWSSVDEPFRMLLPQGMVMGKAYTVKTTGQYLPKENVAITAKGLFQVDTNNEVEEVWEKMSKSRYNGVSPLDVMQQFGSDMTRLMMMDNVSPREPRNWKTDGFRGLNRWVNRVAHIVCHYVAQRKLSDESPVVVDEENEILLKTQYNRCVHKVSHFFEEAYVFNSAIAELIVLTNTLRKQPVEVYRHSKQFERCVHALVIMMNPFAPNISAEFWSLLNTVEPQSLNVRQKNMEVWDQNWPTFDEDAEMKLDFWIGRKPCGFWVLMDRRKLKDVTLEEALEMVNQTEPLQNQLKELGQRIVGGRLETGEFFGTRIHLTLEKLPQDEDQVSGDDVKPGEKKKRKKKTVFVRYKR